VIALEEHLIVPDQAEYLDPSYALEQKKSLLLDYGNQRLADMDAGGIDIAVLSAFSDGVQGIDVTDPALGETHDARVQTQVDIARKWNDDLRDIVATQPERFRGFAALPMASPQDAAQELRRCVTELGFVGALINGADTAADGNPNFYVDDDYDALWQECVDLDRPIYIHPRMKATPDPFYEVTNCEVLRTSPWGFHENTARIGMAMIVNGVFDRFPDLKIILGHMGEILPFWAWRIDHRLRMEGKPELAKVQQALANNFHVTISGFNHTPALRHVLDVMGVDRVVCASDYPMEDPAAMRSWLDGAFAEIGVSDDDANRIRTENAKALLRI
jgi:predicted TIM-barrel fold metal-dependent hydrolase